MTGHVIRPTVKLIYVGYAAVALLVLGAFVLYDWYATTQPVWVPALLLLLFLWPASKHVRLRFTRMTLSGDKLRYETGFLSKTTRTIQLSKIQDVRVDQTLAQRLLGAGDISIETAGETSRLTMHNVDSPQEVADYVMDAAHQGFVKTA